MAQFVDTRKGLIAVPPSRGRESTDLLGRRLAKDIHIPLELRHEAWCPLREQSLDDIHAVGDQGIGELRAQYEAKKRPASESAVKHGDLDVGSFRQSGESLDQRQVGLAVLRE